jgi:hypothetical protein
MLYVASRLGISCVDAHGQSMVAAVLNYRYSMLLDNKHDDPAGHLPWRSG